MAQSDSADRNVSGRRYLLGDVKLTSRKTLPVLLWTGILAMGQSSALSSVSRLECHPAMCRKLPKIKKLLRREGRLLDNGSKRAFGNCLREMDGNGERPPVTRSEERKVAAFLALLREAHLFQNLHNLLARTAGSSLDMRSGHLN